MDGTIYEILMLVVAGNDRENMKRTAKFWQDVSVLKYNKFIRFVSSGKTEFDPAAWFAAMREAGVRGYKLVYLPTRNAELPDYMTSALVGGGGKWMIEALTLSGSQFWVQDKQLVAPGDPADRIWDDTYSLVARPRVETNTLFPSLEIIRDEMRSTLAQALKFTEKHPSKAPFASNFKGGAELLDALPSKPLTFDADFGSFKNLLPLARRILYSAMWAWCFGGMGSWNDEQYNDSATQKEYLKITENLWNTLCLGILVSVNSTLASQ